SKTEAPSLTDKGRRTMNALWQDLRYGARMLLKQKGAGRRTSRCRQRANCHGELSFGFGRTTVAGTFAGGWRRQSRRFAGCGVELSVLAKTFWLQCGGCRKAYQSEQRGVHHYRRHAAGL